MRGVKQLSPYLDEKYKLKAGDALFFPNLDSNNNITELSLHKGSVVKSGEKMDL